MTLLELLKAKWTIYGLDAPIFAWVAAAALLAFTLYFLVRLSWLVHRECRIHRNIARRLEAIKVEQGASPREGLSGSAYDTIARAFAETPSLLPAWHRFDAQIVVRRGIAGDDRFWASESAEAAFNEASVIESRLNRSFFTAIPGIVTGAGLLVTFLAILVALLDVKIVDVKTVDVGAVSKRVEGMETLIHGLSGKFVSSIAALLAATLFLLREKPLFHLLANSRQHLVAAIDSLVPRLSSARILADLQQDISEQSIAFRHFNADLSTKLKQGFSESMGPTLQRMVTTIEDLSQLLRATEAQRQESITGSLGDLLQRLEHSITTALSEMSDRFTESLSGSARQEFDQVINSLRGTAQLLEGMNVHFQTTQLGLNELVNFAKNSTAEQMALGKTQVEELTAVLRELMTQLNETAGSSVNRMAATLTAVVHDLSTKVTALGEHMSSAMRESAGMATGAANTVIQQADTWSRQSAEQLAQLLERHQGHFHQIEELRSTLDETLAQFKDALGQYKPLTDAMQRITAQVREIATSAAGTTNTMKETSESVQRVAELTAAQIERLAEANRGQEETWQRIQDSMRQYQLVFGHVENAASDLLAQIGQHLANYREAVKGGFEELIQLSDEHFTNAVQRLGGSVEELKEYLDELTETLERFSGGGGDHGTQRR